jgi:hypothetical protein
MHLRAVPSGPHLPSLSVPRVLSPQMGIAVEALKLNANPAAIGLVVFSLAWASSPLIASSSLRESKFIQGGAKMKMVKAEPPRVKRVSIPPEVAAVQERAFRKTYKQSDVELLWAALLKCYGSQDLALQAVEADPSVINPSYSFCNTMLASKRALLTLMNEEEAIQVMLQNPSVLQCGPSLEALGAGEIKTFAALRAAVNGIPTSVSVSFGALFIATLALTLALQHVPEFSPLMDVTRPLLGTVLATSFLFSAFAAAKSS